jgi:hypothetical protein
MGAMSKTEEKDPNPKTQSRNPNPKTREENGKREKERRRERGATKTPLISK